MNSVKKLEKGDCIGIFSSSSPTNEDAIHKMKNYFTERGYKVKIAPHTLEANSFMAGEPSNRVEDFHSLIADPNVTLVMTANGGESAIQMLSLIDFELVRKNPKIICGMSDPTSLMTAITLKSLLPTFHGPNGYNFGHTDPTKFTEENWWQMVTGNFSTPYIFPVNDKLKILKNGNTVVGEIIGGNLGVFCSLLGTPYFPDVTGKILFFEEIFREHAQIDSCINQLRLAGVFDKVVGLIVGENVECNDSSESNQETYEELLLRNFKQFNFPIVYNIPLGHTDDKITIPLGMKCSVNLSLKTISLIESPFK